MDVINLQGIWVAFPALAGKRKSTVAGLYGLMIAQHRRRQQQGVRAMAAREMRFSLLKEIEARIVRDDLDDLVLALAA